MVLSDTQVAIREAVRAFSQHEIRPRAAEFEGAGAYPRRLFRELAGLGLMGMTAPEKWAGAGADYVSCAGIDGRGGRRWSAVYHFVDPEPIRISYRARVLAPAHCRLLPGATQQFVESGDDLLALGAKRSDNGTKLLQCHRDDLERVKDDRRAADLERGIEMPELGLADGTCSHERHDNPASVAIELGRLHDYNERYCCFMSP